MRLPYSVILNFKWLYVSKQGVNLGRETTPVDDSVGTEELGLPCVPRLWHSRDGCWEPSVAKEDNTTEMTSVDLQRRVSTPSRHRPSLTTRLVWCHDPSIMGSRRESVPPYRHPRVCGVDGARIHLVEPTGVCQRVSRGHPNVVHNRRRGRTEWGDERVYLKDTSELCLIWWT